MSIRHLDCLLEPRSVAVVGASDRAGSVGATVWRNLRAGGFAGPVFPVNPRHLLLDGMPVYARPADLPQAPDLAVLCTPPDTIAGLVDELGRLGTRAVVVMTRRARRRAARRPCSTPRGRISCACSGPNSLGLLTPHLGLNASFAHTDALAGSGAFVSQSGAVLTAMLDWAKTRRIGFSHMVSLGDGARRRLRRPARLPGERRAHALDPALHRVDRLAAQVHVGGARGGAQQAGDRRQGRPRRRRRCAPRPRTPARWPAPTWCSTPRSGAPACCASTRCRTCSWPPRRWRASPPTATRC